MIKSTGAVTVKKSHKIGRMNPTWALIAKIGCLAGRKKCYPRTSFKKFAKWKEEDGGDWLCVALQAFPLYTHYIIYRFPWNTHICPLCLVQIWGLAFRHLGRLAWQETVVKLLQHEKIIRRPQIGYESHFLRPSWPFGSRSSEPENTLGWWETWQSARSNVQAPVVCACVHAACVARVLACRFCNTFHACCFLRRSRLPLTDLSSQHGWGLDKHWAPSSAVTSRCTAFTPAASGRAATCTGCTQPSWSLLEEWTHASQVSDTFFAGLEQK